MVEVVLMGTAITFLHDIQGSQLRQYNLQQARALQIIKASARVWCQHDFIEFHLDTFTTDNLDAVNHPTEGIKRLLFYLEIQLGGKTNATHHA